MGELHHINIDCVFFCSRLIQSKSTAIESNSQTKNKKNNKNRAGINQAGERYEAGWLVPSNRRPPQKTTTIHLLLMQQRHRTKQREM